MVNPFRSINFSQRWVRLTLSIGLTGISLLFLWVWGGLPPQTWRFLLGVIRGIPRVWMLRGPAIFLPLLGLGLLSLTLLVIWISLIAVLGWILLQEWQYMRDRQYFDRALEKAEHIVTQQKSPLHSWQRHPTPEQLLEMENTSPFAPVHQAQLPTHPLPVASTPPSMSSLQRVPILRQPSSQFKTVKPQQAYPEQKNPEPILQTSRGTGTFRLAIGTGLHSGLKRKQKPNEDSLLAIEGARTCDTGLQSYGLFIVADGIGGHTNGQVASRLTIASIRDIVLPTLLSSDLLSNDDIRELLQEAVHHANLAAYKQNREHETDMGSTVTAAMVTQEGIVIANIGDSRTYLYTNQKGLTKVTRDHSLVERLMETGAITVEEVYRHPQRNEIYRCIGDKTSVEIDTFLLPLQIGMTLVLCSDGVWEMVRDPHIEQILKTTFPDAVKASNM
ncbi:MAG: protein phosphatase 2C domain-containing protein, partial [Chloroflexota bacterium]|nr:protein phosphatase 2C domain-containing protein [Chloroflexota bacterium]